MDKFHKGLVLTPADFKGVDWIKKMADAGLNTLGIHSGGGEAHNVIETLGSFADQPFRDQVAAAHLDWEYESHASNHLLDPALFEEHPEYFARTLRSGGRSKLGNWCVSTPGVLELVAENAAALARRLPSSTGNYFFWGRDTVSMEWCFCPDCAPLTFSDQSLITSNAIARRLRRDDPGAKVCFLAYHSTIAAPVSVRPDDNVFCEFAPYFRSYEHTIFDPRSAANRAYLRHLFDLLELFSPERLYILEYWLDASLFGRPKTPHRALFNKRIAEEDIRFYTSLGIRRITTFAVCQDEEYLRLYGDRDFLDYAEILSRYE